MYRDYTPHRMLYSPILIWRNVLFDNKTIRTYDINVIIDVSTLQLIYICLGIKKYPTFIGSKSQENNIYIHNFYQEWLPTFMLELWLSIISLLTVTYMKVIIYIQCYICMSTRVLYNRSNSNKSLPKTRITSLVINNNCVTAALMEDTADMIH